MTPYLWRLCCLSLAALFVVQVCAGLALRFAALRLVRMAGKSDPARAATLMLVLRWSPAVAGIFFAICLCVPAYLRLEPLAGEEEIGWACAALASLAVSSYLIPIARAAAIVVRSEIRLRRLVRNAEECAGLHIIRETSPAMALAGLFHSRVVVSREVMALLSPDQLDAARRHERAHLESGDNWKRLLLACVPIDCGGRPLRSAWSRFTEWAADDKAAGGDSARSIALASALIAVARLTSPDYLGHTSMLVSDGCELRARVERLLESPKQVPQTLPVSAVWASATAVVATIVVAAQHPACAAIVHRLLEVLVD